MKNPYFPIKRPCELGGWYDPKVDGTLEEYLTEHDGLSSFPLFKGYVHYKMLWDKGYFIANRSSIRIMWSTCRDDENYWVIGEYQIQGVTDLAAHNGREGIFDPRIFLEGNCPSWEADGLNLIALLNDTKK